MAQKENLWFTFTLMNRWIFTFFSLIIAWLATACDFHELPEALAPVKIRGILMATPDSAAANHQLTLVQIIANGERIEHGSTTTDELGIFEFEYARNNQMSGGTSCFMSCQSECYGLEIWHEGSLLANCFPTNKRYDLMLYLSNTMSVILNVGVNLQETDTLYVNLVPIDTNHPNYFRGELSSGLSVEALRLTGPIDSGTTIAFRTTMQNPRYGGLQEQLRDESIVIVKTNINKYAALLSQIQIIRGFPNQIGFSLVRFKGEPYTDFFTISSLYKAY